MDHDVSLLRILFDAGTSQQRERKGKKSLTKKKKKGVTTEIFPLSLSAPLPAEIQPTRRPAGTFMSHKPVRSLRLASVSRT